MDSHTRRHLFAHHYRPDFRGGHVPDVAGSALVAAASTLHPRRLVHPPARINRLASPLGRLDWRTFRLRGRHAVHAVDMVARGWARRAVAVVAARADLPRLPDLAVVCAAVVVGVGLAVQVSAVVILVAPLASWGT